MATIPSQAPPELRIEVCDTAGGPYRSTSDVERRTVYETHTSALIPNVLRCRVEY